MNPFPLAPVGKAPDPAGGSSGGLLLGGSTACAVSLMRAWFRPMDPAGPWCLHLKRLALTGCLSAIPGSVLTRRENCGARPFLSANVDPEGQRAELQRARTRVAVSQQRAPSRPGSGSRQQATLPAHLRLAWQHGGARCPGASFLAPLFTPAPSATRQRLPGLAAGQRVDLPPVGLWGNSDPTEVGTPPACHVWSHSNRHIWGKEVFAF